MILLTVSGTHQADIMTWLDHEHSPDVGKLRTRNEKIEPNYLFNLCFSIWQSHKTRFCLTTWQFLLRNWFAHPDLFVMTEVTMQGRGIIVRGKGLVTSPSPRLLTNGQDFLHHYFCPRHTESNRTEVICSDISYGTQERDQVKLFFLAIIHWFS